MTGGGSRWGRASSECVLASTPASRESVRLGPATPRCDPRRAAAGVGPPDLAHPGPDRGAQGPQPRASSTAVSTRPGVLGTEEPQTRCTISERSPPSRQTRHRGPRWPGWGNALREASWAQPRPPPQDLPAELKASFPLAWPVPQSTKGKPGRLSHVMLGTLSGFRV